MTVRDTAPLKTTGSSIDRNPLDALDGCIEPVECLQLDDRRHLCAGAALSCFALPSALSGASTLHTLPAASGM